MSSGFRFVVTKRDTTKLKAYGLAVAVQMILVPLVLWGIGADPTLPPFHPVGAVTGGLLFGASMSVAGGCAAGVWYKVGGGSLDALAAALGMILGAAALEIGPLAGLRDLLQSPRPPLGLTGSGVPSLLVAVPLGLVIAVALLRSRVSTAGDWTWRRTGLLVGLTGVIAWPLSWWATRGSGMAVIPGTVSIVSWRLGVGSGASLWDLLFVLGIPAGAYLATRAKGPQRVAFSSWPTLLRRFLGGLGLGVGASLAAGCTVGHGLTGVPLLAPGSLVAMLAIFAGSTAVALFRMGRPKRV